MAWIKTVDPEDARGPLRDLYDQAIDRHGDVAGIIRLMSCDPATLKASIDLYLAAVMETEAPNERWFRELIALTVSRLNRCFY